MINNKLDYITELLFRSAITTALPIFLLVCSGDLHFRRLSIRHLTLFIVIFIVVMTFHFVVDMTLRFEIDE